MPHLHVALVNERPETSLIPLLQLRPQQVVLVVDPLHRQAAERVRILLQHELPNATDIRTHDGLPTQDPQRISAFASRLADTLRQRQADNPDLRITYDLGGVSRLTALLFQHALHRCRADWLYVDNATGALYRLGPDLNPETLEASAIEPVLDVDLYLLANGRKRVKSCSDNARWREGAVKRQPLTRYLAHHADKLSGLLDELAGRVYGIEGEAVITRPDALDRAALNDRGQHQQLHQPPVFPETDALSQLADAGLLEWSSRHPQSLYFPNLEGARYLGGDWLREYAWCCVREAGIAAHCGAHVFDLSGQHNAAPVVFDCLAVHHNQLLIIDCPAPQPGSSTPSPRERRLHRLYQLVDHTVGLASTRLLLSDHDVGTAEQRATLLQHARGQAIALREGVELKRLTADLRQWRETGRWPDD